MTSIDSNPMLAGILPVFQTPFHDDESIDWHTLDRELDWLFNQGANGVVMAMVSEILRLSTDERRQMAEHVCRSVARRGALVVSVGAESTHSALELARHAECVGATAIMAIPPVSISLGSDELSHYYRRLIEAVAIPVIVQDASGYVGRPMPIAMQARLIDEFGPSRVLFKPEATPLGPNLSALREVSGGRALVFEGSGGIALVDSFRRGIVGTMPGADLIRGIVPLWQALQAGNEERIYRLSLPISALVALQTGLDGFLAVEKHLLKKQGIFENTVVRGPVAFHLDEETRYEVDRLFEMMLSAVNETSANLNPKSIPSVD
jgi:dihydrodipicolinate synthase/N-acetylneuraminate lyase